MYRFQLLTIVLPFLLSIVAVCFGGIISTRGLDASIVRFRDSSPSTTTTA
ncbi:hypothetical protein BDN70DRAFT_939583 [Pholiota conissans]|uniref:Uncharacterized protein n=1 Tax=Pholiota conissans TaxID=109636 RepID=A0A9P5YL15_9AGAR|nr:hypothetical protein BDN70DRAFT_939583 [Pholiota conissans]